jgi:Sec-independent protein translocase protein TatA
MNFMGIGLLEMGVIFLITFLVVGPNKTIDMARTAGRLMHSLRQTLNEITAAIDLNIDEAPKQEGPTHPRDNPLNTSKPRDQK